MGIYVLLDLFGSEPSYAGGNLYTGELSFSNKVLDHLLGNHKNSGNISISVKNTGGTIIALGGIIFHVSFHIALTIPAVPNVANYAMKI